jgi:hypothetical protein
MFVVFWREHAGQSWQPQIGFPKMSEANDYVERIKDSNDRYHVPICYRGEYHIQKCQLVYYALPR